MIPSLKLSLGMVTVDLVYASKEGRRGAHCSDSGCSLTDLNTDCDICLCIVHMDLVSMVQAEVLKFEH